MLGGGCVVEALPSRPAFGLDANLNHPNAKQDVDGYRDNSFYDELKQDLFDIDGGDDVDDDLFDTAKSTSQSKSKSKSMDEYSTNHDDAMNTLDDDRFDFDLDDTNTKQKMYGAYNELHSLAQSFNKQFDAPAVVVVGHQSSGKSALIEALMGFQFNQVGGGTKTRRPIALKMQHNPLYPDHPRCFLELNGVEQEMTLKQIQDYIEQENSRLERDPLRSFDSREINIRMEYKHCPNLILIDTPGLIAAPKVSKGRAGQHVAQQRALAASAAEAERLVVEKLQCQDYLILCVEDTADWKHGMTREIVQKADPDLSRTIIVNTKLDTKLPQFGTPSDVQDFLRANILDRLSPQKLGGPYFTSIPSGRVGSPHDADGYFFDSNEGFVMSCADAERKDRSSITKKLTRSKTGDSAFAHLESNIGLSNLRRFLEEKVDECYRRNVQKILPMLKEEQRTAERKLQIIERELDSISLDRLKAGADTFCDEFCAAIRKAMQGSVVAPSNVFGETLQQETSGSGIGFHNVPNSPMSVSDRTWERLVGEEVGHQHHRLYGGSQYHRCLREFNLATKCLRLPTISEDEIANAAGVGTTHDGVNFLHAACVIALEKARVSFEPMLEALRVRVMHVMERLCPVAEYMIQNGHERNHRTTKFFDKAGEEGKFSGQNDIASNPQFRQLVRNIFEKFVQKCSDSAIEKSQDDLISITKFVTWNTDQGSSGALCHSLPDQMDMIAVYNVALKASGKQGDKNKGASSAEPEGLSTTPTGSSLSAERALRPMSERGPDNRDYFNLLQLIEEAICSRNANRTNLVVGSLVQHIVAGWREAFGRTVTMKFNCYFMLPFVDDFHKFMRNEFQEFYESEDDSVFDLASARRSLQRHKQDLDKELSANKRLQEKFRIISQRMHTSQHHSKSRQEEYDF